MEKIRLRISAKEDPIEKIRRRRSDGEDPTEKAHRRRGLNPESTMALTPCEMREEKHTFLY